MAGLILIVDDEQDLVSTLQYNLERDGFQTRSALTGKEALRLAAQSPLPDLVVLDLMLPDLPGTEVCKRLKSGPTTKAIPIVMLTAKGEEIDRVVGFEVGADDYVTKPFSVRELILRVKAVLRRSTATEPVSTEVIVLGALRVDPSAHQVWWSGAEIVLTALEFKLLNVLVSRKGRVQTRKQLLDDVWGIQADVTTRTVDTHVKRLRAKLGEAGELIETLRGVGYRVRPRGE